MKARGGGSLYNNNTDSDSDSENLITLTARQRHNSFSDDIGRPREFLVDVQKTKAHILRHEDTDGDERVTIEDKGPKHLQLPSYNSGGYFKHSIKGNYMVSSLLQELALLENDSTTLSSTTGDGITAFPLIPTREHAVICGSQLQENPVDRLNRMIQRYFWPALLRTVDAEGLTMICLDSKNRESNKQPRIYVPYGDRFALDYFEQLAKVRKYLDLEVIRLPEKLTAEYISSINGRPGILALDLEKKLNPDGMYSIMGKPFLVPGGRFNEMYGWDSYFAALGLLDSSSNWEMLYVAKSMVDNFVYQINHYGMILNANRSYYLLRSQPPFLTDMALQVYQALVTHLASNNQHLPEKSAVNPITTLLGDHSPASWLKMAMSAAIKEYRNVWMSPPRLIPKFGLSRYCSEGKGVPPETEATHFDSYLAPYLEKYHLDMSTFVRLYNKGEIKEPDLDEYFLHDRAVRESGHDTTYRLDGRAANLFTIDLCALLYKYENDIADFLELHCGKEGLELSSGNYERAEEWRAAASRRKALADQYLWSEGKGMYFDYDFVRGERIAYESVTTLFPLWSGMASKEQAERLVKEALPKFEVAGGLVSGSRESLGEISLDRPTRQWDYPYGWAPHQILAWRGLCRYGFNVDARRLAYRWLYMITRAFSDFNGVVAEKFNVVKMSHKVHAEYGNVGTDFKKVPREGFGWVNASYLIGQRLLTRLERRALGALVPPETLLGSMEKFDPNKGAD